jgi:hypothetical protein
MRMKSTAKRRALGTGKPAPEVRASGLGSRRAVGRLPPVGQKLVDPAGRVGLDAGEHVGQVGDRVDAVLLAGGHERVEASEVVAGILVADEEEIRATQGDAPQAGLGDVVVRGDRGEAQEAAERPVVVEQVSDRPAHSGTRLEGAAVPAPPAEQPSEERPRALAPKGEVLGRTDDAGVLRVAFHDVDRADEVEGLLRFGMLALLVDLPSSMGDTLEADWNEKLRALAKTRDERERARREDQIVIDDAIRERLVAMTTDFTRLWSDPATPNRERKRMLAYVIEDATLVKLPQDGTTKVHIRFRGGQTTTLTTLNPKASCQKVKTPTAIVELVDRLLEDHLYEEIAGVLNARGLRPGGSAWPGKGGARFTALRVQYIVHTYGLRLRFERLRGRGLLTKKELAARLGIHESTLTSWVKHGIVKAHPYNGHAWLYEEPPSRPAKHSSRWDRLSDRAKVVRASRR